MLNLVAEEKGPKESRGPQMKLCCCRGGAVEVELAAGVRRCANSERLNYISMSSLLVPPSVREVVHDIIHK